MIHWQAKEFEFAPKSAIWYWLSVILAVALIALAVWMKNFLFGFFILVAEILVLVWGSEVPAELDFSLDKDKLEIAGHKTYLLSDVARWSAEDAESDPVQIHFIFKNFRPSMRIPIAKEKLEEARKIFREANLAETEHEYTFIESLEKFLGF